MSSGFLVKLVDSLATSEQNGLSIQDQYHYHSTITQLNYHQLPHGVGI